MKHTPVKSLVIRSCAVSALVLAAASAQAAELGVKGALDTTTHALNETGITATVKTKLATDARVKGSDISVETKNGVTVLTGTAPSSEAKAAAEDIAKSADGVSKVDNRIQAPVASASLGAKLKADAEVAGDKTKAALSSTGEVISDSWITTKVKSQLLADSTTKGTAISVKTKDKVVMLRGTASSQAEKDQAIKLASDTEGVTKVNADKLKVVKTKAKASVDAEAGVKMN